jgi:predicted metal-dependent hydrolase
MKFTMQPDLERGIELFNSREFYACHEWLEDAWMFEVAPRRRFLQSIIHYAVACYHHEKGNPVGAVRQFQKGLEKLNDYRPVYEGVDTERLYGDGASLLAMIEGGSHTDALPVIHLCPGGA